MNLTQLLDQIQSANPDLKYSIETKEGIIFFNEYGQPAAELYMIKSYRGLEVCLFKYELKLKENNNEEKRVRHVPS